MLFPRNIVAHTHTPLRESHHAAALFELRERIALAP
jgi:hypothetical protein